ncbi:MAG: hypothetical protein A2283_02680 [Lentisphaerae bacterium RIFOXYA12_FULL_48_11]|nr:MAG: hypothetical protein A2283_02680 [Lentisphaerae bacterium RIFOXYA12_FULL_48_11]
MELVIVLTTDERREKEGGNFMKFRVLRMLLLFSAFAWGMSVFGVFLPWEKSVAVLNGFGAKTIPNDPMLNYWVRMTAGAYTGIGVFFLVLAINPRRYANVIPMVGLLIFIEGIVLLVHGLLLHLEPLPFYADAGCCLFGGAGIWMLANSAETERQ